MNKKLQILYIAGVSPYHFANMVYDAITALEQAGHEVDFLTLYEFDGQKKNMHSVYEMRTVFKLRKIYMSSRLLKKLRKLVWGNRGIIRRSQPCKDGYLMANEIESQSPVPEYLLFRKLKEHYDLIITAVWENIISAETLRLLYEHYKAPIIMHPADMYPFTGGCQYPGDCVNYYSGCGNCPIINSSDPNDQTHKNFLYKKKIYSSINCALLSNSYMIREAKKCGLFENVLIKKTIFTLNENVYYPHDISSCRQYLGILSNKKFVMFARYVNPKTSPRKGIEEMLAAINLFCKDKSQEYINSMCIILAGTPCDNIHGRLPIDIINAGMLNTEDLIKAYCASTIFVSPSIGDAGPSMVNQAVMCGTPVVCFNIGTAIDLIDQKVNGYKAKLGNVEDLARGFEFIWDLNEKEYSIMRQNTRKIGVERQSLSSNAKIIMDVYSELSV